MLFHKHPKSTAIDEGAKLVLAAEALGKTGSKYTWEFDSGKGWKEIKEGKTLTIKKAKVAHSGKYRCLLNGKHTSKEATILVRPLEQAVSATPENDAFLEILEGTGKDASPELIQKVQDAVKVKLPEELKV